MIAGINIEQPPRESGLFCVSILKNFGSLYLYLLQAERYCSPFLLYTGFMQSPVPGRVNWLYLDLNSYFASVEQQLRPELRGKPVAVTPVMTDTACCIAASYEAKRFGIQTGTDVRDAKRLCPELVLVEADQARYVEYHHRIVAAIGRRLPVTHVCSIDEFACRLSGPECLPPSSSALAAEIKQTLRQDVGDALRCSIGLAPNLFLGKTASDMRKPDGLTLLDAACLPAVLFTLTLRDLPGIGPRMEAHLREQRISSIQELWKLTPKQIRALWGSVLGERLWYKLRGYDFDEPAGPQQSIGHQHVLPPALRTIELAEAVARKLLGRAAVKLRQRQLWARGLSIYVSFTPGREKRLFECHTKIVEAQDTFTLLEIFNRMWAECPQGKPTFVGVELYDLLPDAQHTATLLPEESGRARLAAAMDNLQQRFGERAAFLAGTDAVRNAALPQIAFSSIPEIADHDQCRADGPA